MFIFGYIASILMGVVLGLVGTGGSILTVPIMVYIFGFPPVIATSYALFVVGATALTASMGYLQSRDVHLRTAVVFAVPSVAGVCLARGILLPRIPRTVFEWGSWTLTKDNLVMVLFAMAMVGTAVAMLRKREEQKPVFADLKEKWKHMATKGFFVGTCAGFVGVGGGFLIVPVLVVWAGLKARMAVGTSLLIIATQSFAGFMSDWISGVQVHGWLVVSIAIASSVGIVFGSRLSIHLPEEKLKTGFGLLVLAMGVSIFLEQLRHI